MERPAPGVDAHPCDAAVAGAVPETADGIQATPSRKARPRGGSRCLQCALHVFTVDTDKKTYLSGETITVTTTLTTSGAEPTTVFVLLELIWSDPQIAGVPGPAVYHTALTSGGGAFNWTLGFVRPSLRRHGALPPVRAGEDPSPAWPATASTRRV
jgi:hypothetical protein